MTRDELSDRVVDKTRKFLQWLSVRFPNTEHTRCSDPMCLNKVLDVEAWDSCGAETCCGICGCCPCYAWTCGHCLWDHKLRKLTNWIWDENE